LQRNPKNKSFPESDEPKDGRGYVDGYRQKRPRSGRNKTTIRLAGGPALGSFPNFPTQGARCIVVSMKGWATRHAVVVGRRGKGRRGKSRVSTG